MSAVNCIAKLAQAAGRQLTDDEVAKIFERVHKAALDIKAGRVDPNDVKLGKLGEKLGTGAVGDSLVRQAAERAAIEMQAEAMQIERQANLQVTKLAARAADTKTLRAQGLNPLDAVEKIIARDYSGRYRVESLEQRVTGYQAYFGRKLLSTWGAFGNDMLGFFQDRDKLLNLVKELRGENTGDAMAKKGAKAFHDTAEEARLAFNEAGGNIGKLDDWGMPQHHSQFKVADAGGLGKDPLKAREFWVDKVLPMLDRSKYTDDAGQPWTENKLRDFLGKAWDTIATNGHANDEPGAFRGTGKRANRHAEHRQIHFKDAESVISYWEQFGEKTAFQVLHDHINSMARDIAFIEHFGPNPNLAYQTLRDQALKDATTADPKNTEKYQGKAIGKLDNLYNYAAGKTKPTYRQWLKQTADGISNLNVAGKLGGSALASFFGDKPMMEAVAHMNNLPALQRWRTELALFDPTNKNDRALLKTQGLMLDSVRSGLQRFYEGLGDSGGTGKMANAVMRVTGMQAINDIRKGAFGLSLMSAIGNEIKAGVDFAKLPDSDIRTLRNYGITEADWKVWKLSKLDDMGHGNDSVLTPESISRIPDADLLQAFPERTKAIRDQAKVEIDELQGRNAEDTTRLQNRIAKFQAEQQKVFDRFDAYQNRAISKADVRVKALEARAELLKARTEKASAQADLEAFHLTTEAREDFLGFVDQVLDGKSEDAVLARGDKSIYRFARRRGSVGERIGDRIGKAETRIAEIERNIEKIDKQLDKTIDKKYEEIRSRLDEKAKEIDEYEAELQKRADRRQAVIDRISRQADEAVANVPAQARRDAIVKLLGAVNTESEFAIVTPGWKERAQFYGDLQRGTVKGEIWRSVLQFKSFPWAMFQRGMDAIANMETPASKATMAAYLITTTTLAGAMLMQTRDVLSGKDPRAMANEDWWKFWSAAFLQGGALGIYGDFLYGANHTRYGSGPIEALSGPTLGPLLEIGLVQPLQAISDAMEGKDTHLGARTFQDLKGFVPGGNIWYLKAALDHLVWQQAMETLSPGYLRNMRQRTKKEYGQRWWYEPGDLTPDRVPDFGAAIDQ